MNRGGQLGRGVLAVFVTVWTILIVGIYLALVGFVFAVERPSTSPVVVSSLALDFPLLKEFDLGEGKFLFKDKVVEFVKEGYGDFNSEKEFRLFLQGLVDSDNPCLIFLLSGKDEASPYRALNIIYEGYEFLIQGDKGGVSPVGLGVRNFYEDFGVLQRLDFETDRGEYGKGKFIVRFYAGECLHRGEDE